MATKPSARSFALPANAPQALLLVLAAYGLWSFPALIDRWGWSWTALVPTGLWMLLASCALPLMRGSPTRAQCFALGISVIILRVGAGWLALGRVSSGDPYYYVLIARQLLAGQGYFVDEPYMGIRALAFFPPAYPLLLAGWGAAFGLSTWSLLIVNSLTDLAGAALIGRIGSQVGYAGAGRAAAFLYLIWPSALLSAGLAQKESLAIVLVLALALVWVSRAGGGMAGWRGALALGLPAGLLALTQPGQAALAALFGLVLVGRIGLRRVIGFGLTALPVATAVMLPWWIRNAIALGAFVPLTSAGGLSLWIGNSPDATGNWIEPPRSLHRVPELEFAKRAAAMARVWILQHPFEFVRLTIAKFFRAIGVGQFGVYRLAIMSPPLPEAIAMMLMPWAHLAQVVVLAGAGIGIRLRERKGMGILALLVLACLMQLAMFGVWFEFGERHREFMTPFLLLVICAALSSRSEAA